jgi:RND family efflux transporter MFP subunit
VTRRPAASRRAALAAVAALALALTACDGTDAGRGAPPPEPAPAPRVRVAPVVERTLPATLDVTGTLQADARTEIAAEVDGRLAEVGVERGLVVEAGALLARIDDRDAVNQLREAEAVQAQTEARLGLDPARPFAPEDVAEVRQARVTLERMATDLARYGRLVEAGAVSQAEHEARRAEYLAQQELLAARLNDARQTYQALQAQKVRVAMARKQLADTVIRAPYAGLIAERHAQVGDYVRKGAPVATLVRVDPLRVELAIPEAAVPAVRRGQAVAFTVQAFPDRTFQGTIAYVGPALKPDVRALVVEAIVPNPRRALQPGYFVTARVELPGGAPTPFVPAAALRGGAGGTRVFVVAGDRAEARLVQVGRTAGDLVEVLRGVRPGERVAVDGLDGLADGMPVTVAEGR